MCDRPGAARPHPDPGHPGGALGTAQIGAHFRKTPSLFILQKYQVGSSDVRNPQGGFLHTPSSSGIGGWWGWPGQEGARGAGADEPWSHPCGARGQSVQRPPTPMTSGALQG